MAVRVFDLTRPQSPGLAVVEAPLRRSDRRRLRRRYATAGVIGLVVPFAVAMLVIGVVH